MMRRLVPLAAALLAAVLGFWITLNWIPGFIMSRAMEQVESGGAAINSATHAPPVTEASRNVVRPSPDILYSICPFDLSHGPLLIQARWPRNGGYASISLYDSRTNNIFTLSDRDAGRAPAIWLDRPGTAPVPDGATAVSSPTQTGLVLYRQIVEDPSRIPAANAERRSFRCDAQ
ncbi:DUF1254 domain-containing protein [Maricaulis salignorans]|uniref:Uncharacterized membrane protein n=1 Tax=Maricaulis salignorans TaxID=144026 RepID=A0A1G9SUD2_9PROT|nr:DUF1254 domain-containing protein [Maricaulis salignorans]SDM39011.1 Uncharacterized membrane protein [Maricaulis salignorans]